MVHKHPFRHDPSHIVTHRIQSNIVNFADYLIKVDFPCKSHEWSTCLHAVNMMVMNHLEGLIYQLFGDFCCYFLIFNMLLYPIGIFVRLARE